LGYLYIVILPINSTQINKFPEGLHRVLLLMIEKVR